jgi:predicted SnoaL-like aldol condensation-catalyzing enzyme
MFFVACGGNKEVAKNKEIVKGLFDEFFVKKNVAYAEKYMDENYIQHNPYAADGRKAFIEFFQGFWKGFPEPVYELKRIIAEGDLVVVHYLVKFKKEDKGFAVVDILRVKNGKIAEHWDVMTPVVDKPVNNNTMF